MKFIKKSKNYNKYKHIREFWEFSKSSYGQDQSNQDSRNTMYSFNDVHGYGVENKWVLTDKGKVFIEKMEDGTYYGNDESGNTIKGDIKGIIRTLMEKEKEKVYDFGCVMLFLNDKNTLFKKIQSEINEKDIYYEDSANGYGLEKEPHVTILQGIHNNVKDSDVESIINNIDQFNFELGDITLFENENCDVLKFDVKSDKLNSLHKKFKSLRNTQVHDTYHPHITIAYIKKGKGEKYIKKLKKVISIKPIKIVYTKCDGSKKEYDFNKKINESLELDLNITDLQKIGEGTVGEVYSDNKFAYKILEETNVPEKKEYINLLNINHPNIVKVYNVYKSNETIKGYSNPHIVKMELLEKIPFDSIVEGEFEDEYNRVRMDLWDCRDDINLVKKVKTDHKELQRMVDSIISAMKVLGSVDVGFHNLMYDSVLDTYKQIDIV